MFEFDAGKFIIIGIVALIVIGPKELPRVMRQVGLAVGKMRKLAGEFQSQFMEAMREADVAEIKAEAEKLANQAKIDVGFNPVAQVKAELTEALQRPSEASQARLSSDTAEHALPDARAFAEPDAARPAGQGAPASEMPAEAAGHTVTGPLSNGPAAPEHAPLRTGA